MTADAVSGLPADDVRAGQVCACSHEYGCPGTRGLHEGPDGDGPCTGTVRNLMELVRCRCPGFRRDEDAERARDLADEDPRVALHLWDAARPRSQKTAEARAEGTFGVGPSDVANCRKRIEIREKPPKGYVPEPTDKSAAVLGTLIHDGYTAARKLRYPDREFGRKVRIIGVPKEGEVDEYSRLLARVTDYTTAGRWRWERLGQYGPEEDKWDQAFIYALALEDLGEPVREVELIYINVSGKGNGGTETFRRPYSREAALRALARLHAILDALEAGTPLPRDREGPTLDPICASCEAVRLCWNLDEVPARRTPESYLLVRDDATVAGLLEEYDRAREEAKPPDHVKERVKVLVEGVEPGRYGDLTLRWTGGRPDIVPDPKARIAQLEAALEEREPGASAALPWPTMRVTTRRTIKIERVRVAQLDAERAQQAAEEAS